MVAEYIYDAWGAHSVVCYDENGALLSSPPSDHVGLVNPFRYRGYFWDNETGLFLVTSRYYDPETGRFISPDDISYLDPETIGGLNLYAYCWNNPVMYNQGAVSSGGLIVGSSISIGDSNSVGGSLSIGSSVSASVRNGSAPWYVQTIVGAIPDLYTCGRYLFSKGMHQYFAYKKNYYYMFPILGANHKRLAIHSTNFGKMYSATFKELVTGNAKASLSSVVGNIAGVGVLTFATNLLFNLHENGFNFTDKSMWIDTGIDTAIGMGAYSLAMGTASLATAGLAMAGVALPGVIVIGGVIILSIGFEHLIRAITGYWE